VGTLVVDQVAGQATLAVPLLDGVGAHAQLPGGLVEADEAAGAQPLFAGGQAVVAPDVMDDSGRERKSGAGDETGSGQGGRDAGVGVVVEEPVDFGHDADACPPGVGGSEWQVEGQAGGLSTLEPDVHADLVVAAQGDVLDEQPEHAFAFPLGGARVVPEGGEV